MSYYSGVVMFLRNVVRKGHGKLVRSSVFRDASGIRFMDADQLILATLDAVCRQMGLDDISAPTWEDAQFVRSCSERLKRGERSAWDEFEHRMEIDAEFRVAMRSLLIRNDVLVHDSEADANALRFPAGTVLFSPEVEARFLKLLGPSVVHVGDSIFDHIEQVSLIQLAGSARFVAPSVQKPGKIMYIEKKFGLTGPARIGRVTSSKTGKTLYYDGMKLQSLKGTGYKANFYDVDSGTRYWISECRKDGRDALYPRKVEIDEDVRNEYWIVIRRQPHNVHLTEFRSIGKYSKRKPRRPKI